MRPTNHEDKWFPEQWSGQDTATMGVQVWSKRSKMVNSCDLFTVQPVAGWNMYSWFRWSVGFVRVQLWSLLFCRLFCCLCYSSFHLFLLFSLALEYLLLISTEMALILLSRSCFVAAFSGSSACDLRYPDKLLSCKQLKLFK